MRRPPALAAVLLGAALLASGCSAGTSKAVATGSVPASVPSSSSGGAAASMNGSSTGSAGPSAPATPVLAQAALCQLIGKVNTAAVTATSPTEGLAVLRQYAPDLATAARTASAAVKPDLEVLSAATDHAIASGDVTALADDHVISAGTNLLALCGQTAPPVANPTKN